MVVTTDRDVRRRAIANTNHRITTKAQFLEAVKIANSFFRDDCSKLWLQYVRNENNKPIGLVILYQKDSVCYISGSVCDPKDQWDKELAFFYAAHRFHPIIVDSESTNVETLPRKCQGVAREIITRFTSRKE